jgi:hypothetical protein
MPMPRHIRIFLSSPSDVSDERDLARTLIKEGFGLKAFLRDRATIDVISWDDPEAQVPLLAHLTPQEAVNRNLPKPSECDIVVVILWSRLGTPLPSEMLKPDGSPWLSGTEWEYHDALTAAKRFDRPAILLYRRSEIPQIPINLAPEEVEDRNLQYGRVNTFLANASQPNGSIVSGFHQYRHLTDFRDMLSQHLQSILRSLLDKDLSEQMICRIIANASSTLITLMYGHASPSIYLSLAQRKIS